MSRQLHVVYRHQSLD